MGFDPFWKNKKVLITGHTGFKGSWLSLWLHRLGAKVSGYSLEPRDCDELFVKAKLDTLVTSRFGCVSDYHHLEDFVRLTQPEIIFHMAAQPFVRDSYAEPRYTYMTNVIGTVNILEVARQASCIKTIVNVTTDKCYENQEWVWGYRETDRLGGKDPYSNSKACSELVTQAYRHSYFSAEKSELTPVVVTARAGNVIGGGDRGQDRLVPTLIRSLLEDQPLTLRYPNAIRPWQYVLDPLRGYLALAKTAYEKTRPCADSYNFGPSDFNEWPVSKLVDVLTGHWGKKLDISYESVNVYKEELVLRLDSTRSRHDLNWYPLIPIDLSIKTIIEFEKKWSDSSFINQKEDFFRVLMLDFIDNYECLLPND